MLCEVLIYPHSTHARLLTVRAGGPFRVFVCRRARILKGAFMQKKESAQGALRIAMLGHKFIPSRDGGIEVVVGELSRRLVRLGHQVTCYNRTNAEQKAAKRKEALPRAYEGVRLIWVPTIDRAGLAAVSSSVFATVRAAFGPYDIVHIHAEGPSVICWLPRLMGKKVVVTVHGLDHQRQKWGRFASAYILHGEKAAVRFAHQIIVLSKSAQAYFKKKYGRDTVLIYNGIVPAEPREAKEITERFGLKKDGYILFLSRLVPEKGVHYLIEAYRKTRTDLKLVIAGASSNTDEYTRTLHDMAKDDPNIVFTGFVQGTLLEELFSNAYLYVLPSDLEGMPISLLEAMSYRCCCLTSDISECTDVMGGTGVSFKKGDVDSLREKLQLLCDQPEFAAQRKPGKEGDVSSLFSWDAMVEKTAALYRRMLADQPQKE